MGQDNKQKTSLSVGTIAGYGMFGMFSLGFALCLANYLNLFMTDVIGFSAATAAVLYTSIQIIKMVTMAASGAIIDRISFKTGHYRTWILIAGIITGVSFPLCFLYLDIPKGIYAVVFIVFYFIQSLFYNIAWTAQRAMIAPMSKAPSDFVLLTTTSQFAGTITSIVYMFVGPALLACTLWQGTKQNYFWPCCVYGVYIVLSSVALYAMCGKYENGKAEVAAGKQDKMSLADTLKCFKGPTIPYFFSYTIAAASAGFMSALLGHFATYVLENPSVIALSSGITAICGMVACFVTPALTNKFSKKSIHIVSEIVTCCAYALMAVLGGNQFLFILLRCVATVAGTPTGIAKAAIANDIGDTMEMNGEKAPKAFLQSLAGTTSKAGMVVSAAIGTACLAAIGYETGCVFTQSMKTNLTLLIAILPAGCCALSAFIMSFYKIDEEKLAKYRAEKQKL